MKFKTYIAVFLFSVIVGILIEPLINPAFTPTPKIQSSTIEKNVLGVQEVQENSQPSPPPKESQFGILLTEIAKIISLEKTTPVSEENPKTSTYSGKITVVIFGDSMVQVMGINTPYVKSALAKYYPKADSVFFNYGVGGENIEKILSRIDKELVDQERHYPPFYELKPDIVVIESCAYNPFENSQDELYRHWATLVKITNLIKDNSSAKIILMATIAPHKVYFGQGPAGVNWEKNMSWLHAARVHEYLQNTIKFAQSANLPLGDVYHKSLLPDGEGDLNYINPGDHIHQSEAGNVLIGEVLAETIFKLDLFK